VAILDVLEDESIVDESVFPKPNILICSAIQSAIWHGKSIINNRCGASGYTGVTVYPGYSCGGYYYSFYPNPANDELTVAVLDDRDGKPLADDISVPSRLGFKSFVNLYKEPIRFHFS
jgi:hypothetical protein